MHADAPVLFVVDVARRAFDEVEGVDDAALVRVVRRRPMDHAAVDDHQRSWRTGADTGRVRKQARVGHAGGGRTGGHGCGHKGGLVVGSGRCGELDAGGTTLLALEAPPVVQAVWERTRE